MASEKLKKYLAYYQKILREEPENIEARLRLAALFKEMGSKRHAVEEYVSASKLLAAQGLPLEAIAACKAVLELDPAHTEVQFFLARLFAQAPSALGKAARVAKPLDGREHVRGISSVASEHLATELSSSPMKLEVLNTDEMDAFVRSGEEPITLAIPKQSGLTPSPASPTRADERSEHSGERVSAMDDADTDEHDAPHHFARDEDDLPTGIHRSLAVTVGEDLEEQTSVRERSMTPRPSDDDLVTRVHIKAIDSGGDDPHRDLAVSHLSSTRRRDDVTRAVAVPEALVQMSQHDELDVNEGDDPLEFAASRDVIDAARAETSEDMRETVAIEDFEELRETQSFDPEELRALAMRPVSSAAASWSQLDQTLHKHISNELLDAMRTPDAELEGALSSDEDTLEREALRVEESFELNVFDMDTLHLSEDSVDDAFDERYGPLGSEVTETFLDDELSEPSLDPVIREPTLVSVTREQLPEIPLLSRLNQYAFVELLKRARLREVEASEVILSPGHQRKNLYIMLSGEVCVSKVVDGEELLLGTFEEGDFFGEFALLTGRDHSATVRATRRSRLLEVSEELVGHIAGYDDEIWDTLWEYYHVRMLNNLMVSDAIFGHLRPGQRDLLIDEFELVEFEAGEVVLSAQEPCPYVYLVLFGLLQITPVHEDLPGKTLREGEFFGFVASLSREPCQAMIRAIKDVSLLCLPAERFREVIRNNQAMAAEIRSLLRTRAHRTDLFLTKVTGYADSGFDQG